MDIYVTQILKDINIRNGYITMLKGYDRKCMYIDR